MMLMRCIAYVLLASIGIEVHSLPFNMKDIVP